MVVDKQLPQANNQQLHSIEARLKLVLQLDKQE